MDNLLADVSDIRDPDKQLECVERLSRDFIHGRILKVSHVAT